MWRMLLNTLKKSFGNPTKPWLGILYYEVLNTVSYCPKNTAIEPPPQKQALAALGADT